MHESPLQVVKFEPEETVVAASTTPRTLASALSIWLLATACAGTSERSESIEQVDELLRRIERVQAESAVAKESAHSALNELCTLVSPGFKGDAAMAFAKFVAASDASEEQGETLRDSVEPMRDAADALFRRWTKDMEAFGNSRMRQRSQTRLDETRTSYQSIVGASQAAQIALDAFHDDLRDHATFLRHDLNANSVASLRGDVRQLREQIEGLDMRFDATVAAARAYVESAALYGQVEAQMVSTEVETTANESDTPSNSNSSETATKKRTVTTLKPKSANTANTATPSVETKPAESTKPSSPTPTPTPNPTTTPGAQLVSPKSAAH